MQLFNQYDARWSGHALGAEPAELGPYGCLLTCDAMINWTAYSDAHYTPDRLDELMNGAGIFNDDLLPDNALDRLWPERYETTHYDGWRPDVAANALPTPDTFVRLWIADTYSPYWGVLIKTHFVVLLTLDGWVADPAGGVRRSITAYGSGWSGVKATSTVRCKLLTPKPAPVVVVSTAPPVVAPPAAPPPSAPATPTFSVALGTIVMASGLSFADAQARADAAAGARPGQLYAVLNEKGNTVATAFVALPPAPIALPPIPKPTPAPEHVQQPDFWAVIQSLLIQVVSRFFKRPVKA